MPVKKLNPVTPGTRFRVGNTFNEVTTDKPEKSLLTTLRTSGGRNLEGRRTMRQMGGGHKKRYRVIDYRREKDGIPATVKSIEYDPYRTAFIALLYYADGEKRYIIAPDKLKVGDELYSGPEAGPKIGNAMLLSNVPLGSEIHCIEMYPGQGAVMARSAGTNCILMGREDRYAVIKLPSGEVRRVLLNCRATFGRTSNPDHGLQQIGKAGRNRWKGRRPHVRGVAMNPVDHPMGGGEGKASGGHPISRTGIFAKGQKTRKPHKQSDKLIIAKRKTKV